MADSTPFHAVPRARKKSSIDDPGTFWQCLEELAATQATAFKLVVVHLGRFDAEHLRRVNRSMRRAVNRTITTVVCRQTAMLGRIDLATAFPEASNLHVMWEAASTTSTSVDAAIFISHILESSPAFLGRVQQLTMRLGGLSLSSNSCVVGSIAELLSRCTALEAASFEGRGPFESNLHFQGQGSNPAERTAHMQRQLAMIAASPHLLAPPSWPACACLTSLSIAAGGDAQQLVAALQTTSLVSLAADVPDADAASLVEDICNLHRLTNLTIGGPGLSTTTTPPLLASIAALNNLQQLHFWRSPQPVNADDEALAPLAVPASWSQLASLTHLMFTADFVAPAGLTVLPALQVLLLSGELSPSACPLTALAALTALTELRVDACVAEPEGQGGGVVVAQAVVPAAWRERLQTLEWSCRDSLCIPVVAQLTGLVDLELHHVDVTPELCRVFGKLPLLSSVSLCDATAEAAAPCPSIPHQLLPSLSALPPSTFFSLFVDPAQHLNHHGLAPLHVLARWTNVPCPITVTLGSRPPPGGCLAVKGWTAPWLASALHVMCLAQTPVLLNDDTDVDLLLAALGIGACTGGMGPLCLGKAVTPPAFCRLLSTQHPLDASLTIGQAPPAMPPPYAVGWQGGLALTTRHFTDLLRYKGPAVKLRRLRVEGGRGLGDAAVVALASVACELRHLELPGAVGVGDAGLGALAAGCRKLENVVLHGAGSVTPDGVKVLLTVATSLRSVELMGLQMGVVKMLHSVINVVGVGSSAGLGWKPWAVVEKVGGVNLMRKA